MIKARLKDIENGQILRVRVDDPAAPLDVKAWCLLTGNVLESATEEGNGVWRFFIRKERKR
jgi:TusA-related sulfurtransferase